MAIIMSEGKHKIEKKTLKVSHRISYDCPYCKTPMVYSMASTFSKVDYGYEIWICEKCNKRFQLAFKEIKDKNNAHGEQHG